MMAVTGGYKEAHDSLISFKKPSVAGVGEMQCYCLISRFHQQCAEDPLQPRSVVTPSVGGAGKGARTGREPGGGPGRPVHTARRRAARTADGLWAHWGVNLESRCAVAGATVVFRMRGKVLWGVKDRFICPHYLGQWQLLLRSTSPGEFLKSQCPVCTQYQREGVAVTSPEALRIPLFASFYGGSVTQARLIKSLTLGA